MPRNDIPDSEYASVAKSAGVTIELARESLTALVASLRKGFAEQGLDAPESDYELLCIFRDTVRNSE